jgi:hypothetical protein
VFPRGVVRLCFSGLHRAELRGEHLCTKVVQNTSADEVAVCNLASINLRAFF